MRPAHIVMQSTTTLNTNKMIMSEYIISIIVVSIIYVLYYSATQMRKYASFNKLPGPSSLELLSLAFSNKSAYGINYSVTWVKFCFRHYTFQINTITWQI